MKLEFVLTGGTCTDLFANGFYHFILDMVADVVDLFNKNDVCV